MLATWAKGTGRYDGRIYVVTSPEGQVILTLGAGLTIGHGGYARQVRWDTNKLVLPEHRAATLTLPRLELLHGLEGYWETGDTRSMVYSPELPQGGSLVEPELELPELLERFAGFRIVNAARRAVIFVRSEGGRDVAFAPDPDAPDGTTENQLAHLLSGPSANAAITALRKQSERRATEISYLDGVIGRTIILDAKAHQWEWQEDDGDPVPIDEYRRGDETINLPQMVANGLAVPIGLNQFSGEMVEVVGLTALSAVAYNGRNGDPFGFLVPCGLGESRTIHVVVRHEQGFMVYGFTVARRSDLNAEADARSKQEDPALALTRRPVTFAQKRERTYFVFPGGGRVVHLI